MWVNRHPALNHLTKPRYCCEFLCTRGGCTVVIWNYLLLLLTTVVGGEFRWQQATEGPSTCYTTIGKARPLSLSVVIIIWIAAGGGWAVGGDVCGCNKSTLSLWVGWRVRATKTCWWCDVCVLWQISAWYGWAAGFALADSLVNLLAAGAEAFLHNRFVYRGFYFLSKGSSNSFLWQRKIKSNSNTAFDHS